MSERLESLDDRFVQIYEAARAELVEHEKRKGLIVIQDDAMLLYHGDAPVRRFSGLESPRYNKMKTLGHVPLAIYCLLQMAGNGALSRSLRGRLSNYRKLLESCGAALDVAPEVADGTLAHPVRLHAMALAIPRHAAGPWQCFPA